MNVHSGILQILRKPVYSTVLSLLGLCGIGLAVYSNTFSNSFHFDDISCIIDNSAIRDLSNLRAIWNYRPTRFITYLSIALNYKMGGLNVFGYHIFNLLVHVGSAMLVWYLTLLTLNTPLIKREPIRAHAKSVAFFAGALFLVHPIQTQPVNYIIQRAALLATFFYVASLILYVKARLEQIELPNAHTWKAYYACALAMAVLAILSKEMAVTLPLAICFYELFFLRNKKGFPWKYVTFFFIIMLCMSLVMMHAQLLDLKNLSGVALENSGLPVFSYYLTQLKVEVTYLRLLFLPLNQNIDYDYPVVKSISDMSGIFSFLLLLFIVVAGIRLFKKYKLVSFGIFWFFITLLPRHQFVLPAQDVIFEHRLYLSMVGFSLFLPAGLYYLLKEKRAAYTALLLCLLVACYSVMAYERNKAWKNEFTLWDDAARKSPRKARPYNNRGNAYQNKGSLDQAISDYSKAVEIDPYYAKAYNNRGDAYQKQGNFDQAISDYNKATKINPQLAGAYNNRGSVYQKKGKHDQAISEYSKAIEIDPQYAKAYYNRGNAYQNKIKFIQAISDYDKAIESDPRYAKAYYNRGNVYQDKGNFGQALSDYNKTLELDPRFAEAYYSRGNVFKKKGSLDQAISDYSKAIEFDPQYAKAYNNRGNAYQNKGSLDQALSDYSKAIESDPDFAGAYNNRGNVHQGKGMLGPALSDYNKTIEIDPRFADAYYNRAAAYFNEQEYALSWEDVHKAEALGVKIEPDFLIELKKALGK